MFYAAEAFHTISFISHLVPMDGQRLWIQSLPKGFTYGWQLKNEIPDLLISGHMP